jgi:GAF domain-containing protein
MFNIQRQLEILLEANQNINTTLEVPIVMRTLVSSAITLISATSGASGLFVDGKMVFTEYNDKGEILQIDYAFEPGYGVPGWILKNKKPYITNDAERDPNVIPEIQKALGFYNLIDVPILNRSGKLLGCFEIHNSTDHRPFDEVDIELLKGLSASAAIALENAQLIAQYKQTKEALEAREAELNDRIKELEGFYQMAVNRELKMKELKTEIDKLKAKLPQDKQL